MPGVMILTPGAKAGIVSERLRVEMPAEDENSERPFTDIPLVDLDHVVLGNHTALTVPAFSELLQREIPILVLGKGFRLAGVCTPPAVLTLARIAQFRKSEDPVFVRDIATKLVQAKILNQRRVLQRLSANRTDVNVLTPLARLDQFARKVEQIGPGQCGELLGLEGSAARDYFAALATFFPPGAPMNGRTRQPPKDPPNAVLSYAYTILMGEMICHLHAVGLDPVIGFYHEPAERRASLALDLIEPFRPVIADALALDLLSHGILDPAEHFEESDGGVYLNTEGRKKFHLALARRMERPFKKSADGQHTNLREEMKAQALALKMSIVEGRPFTAYRMG